MDGPDKLLFLALRPLESDFDAKGVDCRSYGTRPGQSALKCFKHTVSIFSPLDDYRPRGLYPNSY